MDKDSVLYLLNAAALVYTAFPDSSNTECPGFSFCPKATPHIPHSPS